MDKSKIALSLFVVSSFFFLVSIFFNLEILELLTKPMIIPSITMYYLFELKIRKYNLFFITSLFFFFLGDMAFMIDVNALYGIGLFLFSMPYLIVIYLISVDLVKLFKKENKKVDFTFVFILFVLLGLLYSVLTFLEVESVLEFSTYIFFGLQLVALGVLTSIMYYFETSKRNFYLILTVASFIMSDLFFILNKNLHELLLFQIINGATQAASYYFYVKYFLEPNTNK